MRKILFVTLTAAVLYCLAPSCSKSGELDESVKLQLDSLSARMSALEAQMKLVTGDIASLQAVISALQRNLYVTKVEQSEEGCILIFSDGTSATIKNGKNGTDGKDGKDGKDAPVIGVKDSLGIYYWVLVDKTKTPADTSWILQAGKQIPVSGKDGADIGVKDTLSSLYWVRIDKTVTPPDTAWLRDKDNSLIQAVGIFSGIDTTKVGYVVLTLTGGKKIELPYKSELDKLVARIQKIDVIPDYTDGSVKLNNGWNPVSFSISPDSLAPKLAAGFTTGKTKFTFLMVQTLTKSATYDTLDVTGVTAEGSTLEVTVSGEKIKSYYYKENGKGGNGCLKISDTVNCCTSGYFSLSHATYPGFEDTLCFAVKDIVWAPVNCGYDATNYKYGMLYQWGRKYGQGYNKDADVDGDYPGKGGNQSLVDISTSGILLSHPDGDTYNGEFYYKKEKWYGGTSPEPDKLWNSNEGTSDPVSKTAYDPCPEGWRVPTYDELNALTGNSGGSSISSAGWDSAKKGYWFNGTKTPKSGEGLFLPAAGSRRNGEGDALNRGINGHYWSSSVDSSYARFLYFNGKDCAYMTGSNRANGFSVRCVQK